MSEPMSEDFAENLPRPADVESSLRDRIAAAKESEQIVCTHRWDTGDLTDPGYCQCQRWANHDGEHHCCCGATDA